MSNNFESTDIIAIDDFAHLCLILSNLVNIIYLFSWIGALTSNFDNE
jgi:hypothetical protein